MKYWLLTTEYPPFYGGGISTYCFFTAKMFVQKGHSVTIFINDAASAATNEDVIDNVRLIRFNPDSTGTSSFLGHTTNLSYAFAQIIKQFIEAEGKPDVIEAQEYLGIAYYLLNYKHLLYDWCRHIPILITAHSPAFLYLHYNHVPTYRYPDYWIGEMERFCLQAADQIICPSHYLIQKIREHFHITNTNISIISNPFEFVTNSAIIERKEEGKILFYGKLSAQKGTFKLLQYFANLWNEGFTETLHLYGGDDIVYHPEGKTMGSIVKEKYKAFIDDGKLKLHKKTAPFEMALHFSHAKLVIVPSTVDNLPYVVLEMMSLGNIVLVSKQGGQAEVIQDGVNGFVFDHEVPDSFQKQLLSILKLEEGERTEIKKSAQETTVANYNFEIIYQQKIKLIENLVEKHTQATDFPFIRPLPVLANENKIIAEKGLLSIVVPYYNMGAYVTETISSLTNCSYQLKEIIIVNDGSSNKQSLDVLNRFRNTPGIKIIDKKNSGLAEARNSGAAAARGEYLAFLDADDAVAADYYTKAIKVFETYNNVDFAGCWTQYFEGSKNTWPTFTPEPPIILHHNTINSSALVYKRAAFLHKGLNDANMVFSGLEDYESVIALLSAGYRGVVLPEILFRYRVRGSSMIRAISSTKKLYLLQYITQKHKNFYATFAAEIANLLQANGSGLTLDNPSLNYTFFSNNRFINKWATKTVVFVKQNPTIKRWALSVYRKIKS